MSLREHLRELRKRLFVIVIVLLVTTSISFIFYQQTLLFALRPVQRVLDDMASGQIVYTQITEMLGVSVRISLLVGLMVASPIVFYQIVMFISPGLTKREKKYLFLFLPGCVGAFLSGILFGYFVLIPPAIRFLLHFGIAEVAPFIRVGNIIGLMVALLFWMGLVFETPVMMFFLARFRVVSARGFARFRRYAIIIAFILGAVITPTFDPVNQLFVAIPIIVLYEIGIWLAKLTPARTD